MKTIDLSQTEEYLAKSSTLDSTALNNEIDPRRKTFLDSSRMFGSSFAATEDAKEKTETQSTQRLTEASEMTSSVDSSSPIPPIQMTTIETSSATNLQHEIINEVQKSTPHAMVKSDLREESSAFAATSTKSDVETTTLSHEATGEGITFFS